MTMDRDDIVRRLETAEILAFPRASAPERAAPADDEAAQLADGVAQKSADVLALHQAQEDGAGDERPSGGGSNGGGGTVEDIIDDLNRSYALVLVGQRALIICEAWDAPAERRVQYISIEAFKAFFANKYSMVIKAQKQEDGTWADVKRPVKWAPLWLMAKERRTFKGIEFFPNPDGCKGTAEYFNLWRGFSVKPDTAAREHRQQKYRIFRDHLLTNICAGSQEHFDWIFCWFAHIVQYPRERIGTAIVIKGGQGTGKTKLGEYMGALYESHYFLVDDPRYVVGQFNNHMASCLLLQVDEGFWAGNKAAEGRLKGLITSQKQMIEAKNIDPIMVDNFVRLMFTSNEDWVVPAGGDERRFAVFDIAPHVAQNIDYFAEMDAEMKAGGLEALLADLLAVDLKAENAPRIRVIPKTSGLLEQKLRSLDSLTSWWVERLMDGAPTRRRTSWPKDMPIDVLFDDYIRTSEKIGVRRKTEMVAFGMKMHKLVPDIKRERKTTDVEQHDGSMILKRAWCYVLPPLAECRAAFEAFVGGQALDWGAGDETQDGGSRDENDAGARF